MHNVNAWTSKYHNSLYPTDSVINNLSLKHGTLKLHILKLSCCIFPCQMLSNLNFEHINVVSQQITYVLNCKIAMYLQSLDQNASAICILTILPVDVLMELGNN